MNAKEALALLKLYLPSDQLRPVLTALGQPQIGDICRWDGEHWELLANPEAQDEGSAAFLAIYDLLSAMDTLDEIETPDITTPGISEVWQDTIDQAYQAYNNLKGLMDIWGTDLKKAADREREAQSEGEHEPPTSGPVDPVPKASDAGLAREPHAP